MQAGYRMIDVNVNRMSEGLRVLEDIARFYGAHAKVTDEIRHMRHKARKNSSYLYTLLIHERDATNDIGFHISQQNTLDRKKDIKTVVIANFKRVQEAVRVVEETLKMLGENERSKAYEEMRYQVYTLEKVYLQEVMGSMHRKNVIDTDLYGITAEEFARGRDNVEQVKKMIEAGIKVIQYREKDQKKLYKYKQCEKIRKITREAEVTFIVNDDIDIACQVKADGVHIGQDDLPIEVVRSMVGEEMIIGLSTHSPNQAHDAVARGADYIGVGPIFKTYTKKDVCDPVGLSYLEYVATNLDIPFVSIGGIKQHNMEKVIEKGAKCIAMVTEIVGAEDIVEQVKTIRKIMRK